MSKGAVVKTPNFDSHVAVVKNISNVAVNKLANSHKIRLYEFFNIQQNV